MMRNSRSPTLGSETQTFRYLRTLLGMKIALQPHVSAFLTMWNYQEFFHGHALAHLLKVCGAPLEQNRLEAVKNQAKINEILEKIFTPMLSHIFSDSFPAVYLSFGAIQEMTTLRGYELRKNYPSPILTLLRELQNKNADILLGISTMRKLNWKNHPLLKNSRAQL